MMEEVCARRNIGLQVTQLLDDTPGLMSPTVQEAVRVAAEKLGHEYNSMPSAAGHDARIMSFVTQTGMIFVPSKGGISHSPREFTEPEQILAGIEVLEEAVLELDKRI